MHCNFKYLFVNLKVSKTAKGIGNNCIYESLVHMHVHTCTVPFYAKSLVILGPPSPVLHFPRQPPQIRQPASGQVFPEAVSCLQEECG